MILIMIKNISMTIRKKWILWRECYSNLAEIADESADILISNHALEHVQDPLHIVNEFSRVVRNDGIVVVCVPHEVNLNVSKDDINRHLFTWSPQNLYNLFSEANFEILSCKRLVHAWPPRYMQVQKIFGWRIFNHICALFGFLAKRYQTIIVAKVKNRR